MSSLVDLSDVKSYVGETGSSYDSFLTSQIVFISDVVEAYCRRFFTVATRVQTYYNWNHDLSSKLELFNYPAISITSIVEDGVTLDSDNYVLNKPQGVVKNKNGYFFGAEETVVTYSSGYATLPPIVENVIYSILQERYNKKVAGVNLEFGSDVQRISIPGSISIDFDYTLTNNERKSPFGSILGSHANVLDHFRSHRSVISDDSLVFQEDA